MSSATVPEYMTGLDEFFDYKNQLMNDLMTSDNVLRLLSESESISPTPEDVMYKQVFPYEFVPETIEHGKTFICCEVDIVDAIDKTFLVPVLYIWVFTHKSKVRMPGGGIRVDRLSSEITKLINGSRMYGLGELNLKSAKRFSPAENYLGRVLTFYAKDFNRLSPSNKAVPGNRKTG